MQFLAGPSKEPPAPIPVPCRVIISPVPDDPHSRWQLVVTPEIMRRFIPHTMSCLSTDHKNLINLGQLLCGIKGGWLFITDTHKKVTDARSYDQAFDDDGFLIPSCFTETRHNPDEFTNAVS